MNRWLLATVSFVLFVGLRPGVVGAQPTTPGRSIGDDVRGVFAAKCVGCHGPELAKPKGRFGYVLDLKRIAANPEMVIPPQPTESELWVLVERDEMPPKDSPHGPLTPAQKEVIRAWIAAGAPDASPGATNSPASIQAESTTPAPLATPDRILRLVGKFHLLMIHFPIALVLAAGIGEILSLWRRSSTPSESVRFCLLVAALAAIPTASLGWLHAAAGNGVGSPQLLLAHRWFGTTAAVWLVVTAVCSERDSRRGVRTRSLRLLLMSGILLTALTAHLGGRLAHGDDFFSY